MRLSSTNQCINCPSRFTSNQFLNFYQKAFMLLSSPIWILMLLFGFTYNYYLTLAWN
ncbi:hypothetical protein M8C21_027973, partial [Ambrosia artemisiifolia]